MAVSKKEDINQNNPEIFNPSKEITKNANVKEYDKLYKYSIENREKFWAEQAEELDWYKKCYY